MGLLEKTMYWIISIFLCNCEEEKTIKKRKIIEMLYIMKNVLEILELNSGFEYYNSRHATLMLSY